MGTLKTPINTQLAGLKPIAFVLQNGNKFYDPYILKIRPQDLNKTEPSRVTVHQTLGRGSVKGWVDDFGQGLPTVTINGHTGWCLKNGTDGVDEFLGLEDAIVNTYHDLKQSNIDKGLDPDLVKLIFVDMLDDFVWSVTPIVFALQRSRSQPLLMKYNIQLQAIDTDVENPIVINPLGTDSVAGLRALQRAIAAVKGFTAMIQGWVSTAVGFIDTGLKPISDFFQDLHDLSSAVFDATHALVSLIEDPVGAVANFMINIAADIAAVNVNLYSALADINGIDNFLKSQLMNVKNAFSEVECIFKNSLRPQDSYEDFNALNGASNCSSTTGGNAPSIYSESNAFALTQPVGAPISTNSAANSSIITLKNVDPVLNPIPVDAEMQRHISNITTGVNVEAAA